MAKAAEKHNEWLLVSQALQRVAEIERSEELAERLLLAAIRDGRLPHRIGVAFASALGSEGLRERREVRNEPAPDWFWPKGSFWDWPTVVDLKKSYAVRKPLQFFEAHCIEVNAAVLRKLWPQIQAENNALSERAVTHPGPRSSAPLVLDEVERRLQGSNRHIYVQTGRKRFLDDVADWLSENHPEARPMKAKTIGDHLRQNERIQALLPPAWLRRT